YQGRSRTGQVPRLSERLRSRMETNPTTAMMSPSHKTTMIAATTSSTVTSKGYRSLGDRALGCVPACVGDPDLPDRLGPRRLEAEARVDRQHRRVRVRVPRPDEARFRPITQRALEHGGLEPLTEAVPAVRRGHRRALLPD